jgi:carboxymethylenebutenolidase
MCYEPAARPPLPLISGGAGIAEVEDLVLGSADGARFRAVSARTHDAEAPGIVILPDVRGLHPFYRELAVRFAEAGVHATAIDYFGRTAGIGERDEDFDHMAHVRRTTPDEVAMDVAAAVTHVRSAAGGGASDVFTVGFCFGGRKSFNQAARRHGLAGVMGFYGFPMRTTRTTPRRRSARSGRSSARCWGCSAAPIGRSRSRPSRRSALPSKPPTCPTRS